MEGPKINVFFFGGNFPKIGWVGWLNPKPPNRAFFLNLNFTFCVPKSHKNPGVGEWVQRFGKVFPKKTCFFWKFLQDSWNFCKIQHVLYFLNAGVQGYQIWHSRVSWRSWGYLCISTFLWISLPISTFRCIPLHFSAFLWISLNFSECLWISLHFSTFLYISHFTFHILGQFDGAYCCLMNAIFDKISTFSRFFFFLWRGSILPKIRM